MKTLLILVPASRSSMKTNLQPPTTQIPPYHSKPTQTNPPHHTPSSYKSIPDLHFVIQTWLSSFDHHSDHRVPDKTKTNSRSLYLVLGKQFKGRVPGVKAKSVDTTGVGDAFVGGILSILTSDTNLRIFIRSIQLHHIFNMDIDNGAEETPTLIDRKV